MSRSDYVEDHKAIIENNGEVVEELPEFGNGMSWVRRNARRAASLTFRDLEDDDERARLAKMWEKRIQLIKEDVAQRALNARKMKREEDDESGEDERERLERKKFRRSKKKRRCEAVAFSALGAVMHSPSIPHNHCS